MKTVVSETSESPTPPATWLASILAKQNPAWLARYIAIRRRIQQMAQGQRRWLLRKAAVSVTGAALLLALSQAPTAHAATITVDNGVVAIADDGDCSLPEAIINANNDSQLYASAGECAPGSGADTITLSGGTYTLTTVDNTAYYSDNGLPLIDSDITIDGNGATIERDGAAPDFRIMAVTPSGNLTLNDTTLSGGYSEEDGGALYNYEGTVLIQNSTLSGNGAYDDGGAVENDGGVMIIDNSLIDDNEAGEYGGGVANEDGGELTIRNGTVISNNYAYDSGGGVQQDESAGPLTITDSTISGNEADNRGGGVYVYGDGSTVTIDNSTIAANEAFLGGGIASPYGDLVIRNNSIISGNSAYVYGGIATYKSDVTIESGVEISGNDAVYGGGANFYLSDVTISDSTISGNIAVVGGGGILAEGSTVTIERSLISENEVQQAYGPYFGGGIVNGIAYDANTGQYVGGDMTIIDSTISGNSAFLGGGIANGNVSGGGPEINYQNRLTVYNSTIADNEAYYGGGLLNYGGIWNMFNSTVSGNQAIGGGGIFNAAFDSEPSRMYLSTVTGNEAQAYGGGIAHVADNELLIAGSIVSGNTGNGNELVDATGGGLITELSVLGDDSQTSADAFDGFTPDASDIVATSDGTDPTALTDILDTTLQNNGGPTVTHALVSGSPAIDGVPSAYCVAPSPFRRRPARLHAQCGPRHSNPSPDECDIGAYEIRPAPGRQLLPGRPRVRHGGQ